MDHIAPVVSPIILLMGLALIHPVRKEHARLMRKTSEAPNTRNPAPASLRKARPKRRNSSAPPAAIAADKRRM
jgi:hypothetical protein